MKSAQTQKPNSHTRHLCIATVIGLAFSMMTPVHAQDTLADTWTGRWVGELKNTPARPNAPRVEVIREIGTLSESSTAGTSCAKFSTRYAENGVERGVKEYQLCRDQQKQWFIDEGNGITLQARWLDGMLVSVFKYGKIVLQSSIRIKADGGTNTLVMEEEIISSRDEQKPDEVESLTVLNLQKLVLRKQN